MAEASRVRGLASAGLKKPAYKHDCVKCEWLDSFEHPWSENVGPCDAYICGESGAQEIVIRYGPKKDMCARHRTSSGTTIPEFLAARAVATARGLCR